MGDYLELAKSSLDIVIREATAGDHTVAKGDLRIISLYAAISQAEQTKRLADAQETANRTASFTLEWDRQMATGIAMLATAQEKQNAILLDSMKGIKAITTELHRQSVLMAEMDEELVEDICGTMVDEMASDIEVIQKLKDKIGEAKGMHLGTYQADDAYADALLGWAQA